MALIRRPADAARSALPSGAEGLRTGTPDERRAAARAMALDPANVAPLAAALTDERVPHVREAVLTALARIGTIPAAEAILPLLRSDDAGDRTLALDALRTMTGVMATFLPPLLSDPDPDVRLLACDLARALPPEAATALLIPVLETDTEANVCAAAVEVLAERGKDEAVPALRAVARRFPDDPFLAFAVDTAILGIGTDARRA